MHVSRRRLIGWGSVAAVTLLAPTTVGLLEAAINNSSPIGSPEPEPMPDSPETIGGILVAMRQEEASEGTQKPYEMNRASLEWLGKRYAGFMPFINAVVIGDYETVAVRGAQARKDGKAEYVAGIYNKTGELLVAIKEWKSSLDIDDITAAIGASWPVTEPVRSLAPGPSAAPKNPFISMNIA